MSPSGHLSASSLELLRALLKRGGLYPHWPEDLPFLYVHNDLSQSLQSRAWDAMSDLAGRGIIEMRAMPEGWLQKHSIDPREWNDYWTVAWLAPAAEVINAVSGTPALCSP